jgi:hypothetical protein
MSERDSERDEPIRMSEVSELDDGKPGADDADAGGAQRNGAGGAG